MKILMATFIIILNQRDVDICYSYYNSNDKQISKTTCSSSSRYCCGTCTTRYCCNDINNRLDQTTCKEYCNPYNSTTDSYDKIECSTSSFCCGKCDNQYCCKDETLRIDNSICRLVNLCYSYYNLSGSFIPIKTCTSYQSQDLYCCGDCNNRYCCNTANLKLNQKICVDDSNNSNNITTNNNNNNNNNNKSPEISVLTFAMLGIGVFIVSLVILAIPIIIVVYKFKAEKHRNLSTRNVNRLTNISEQFEMNNMNTTAVLNDKPPSYDTLRSVDLNSPPSYSGLNNI